MRTSIQPTWAVPALALLAGALAQNPTTSGQPSATSSNIKSTELPLWMPLPDNPAFPDQPRDNLTSPSFPDSEYVKYGKTILPDKGGLSWYMLYLGQRMHRHKKLNPSVQHLLCSLGCWTIHCCFMRLKDQASCRQINVLNG